MASNFPKGSEWRRWDLHIHSPASCREVQFGNWETYLSAIENAPAEITAVGITDYASIEGYKKVLEEKSRGRISNISLILPNVELRLDIRARQSSSINIHLLFSNDDPDHVRKIDEHLSQITFEYDGNDYNCSRQSLTALGRDFNSSSQNDEAAYRIGNLQFKVSAQQIRNLKKKKWFSENCLIVFPNNTSDGVSALQNDGGFVATRNELYRLADMIFSSRDGDRQYFAGKGADDIEVLKDRYGGPMPCIHGSDAHSEVKLFRPDGDRFCWIKGDLTFEGLRQTLYEPEGRVFIGPTPPTHHDPAHIIKNVSIASEAGTFPTEHIDLNEGLIAIIGQKGSGKSALAELLAIACGSWYDDEKKSFLERAGKHLEGYKIRIEWLDGKSSEYEISKGKKPKKDADGTVRYLSQRFVEQLCNDDYNAERLAHEIENVIFSYLKPSDTLGASTFSELRSAKTRKFQQQALNISQHIVGDIERYIETLKQVKSLPDKKSEVAEKEKEIERLVEQLPKADDEQSLALEKEISEVSSKIESMHEQLSALKQRQLKLDAVQSKVSSMSVGMRRFFDDVSAELKEIGFEKADIGAFEPSFKGKPTSILAKMAEQTTKSIAEIQGIEEDPKEDTLAYLEKYKAELESKRKQDQITKEKIRKIEKRIALLRQEVKRLEAEINQINLKLKPLLGTLRTELIASFLQRLEVKSEEKKVLEELYSPVADRLSAGVEQEKRLEFYVKWNVDLMRWLERGLQIFDSRYRQPFGSFNDLKSFVEENLESAYSEMDKAEVIEYMNQILSRYLDSEQMFDEYIKKSYSGKDLLEWILEDEHVRLDYGLKFDGVELENLSPGSKGVVLLILYLGIDQNDNRPIIIDQPEENLDNRSVYSLLATYFRKAKEDRQIIIITHNPNLVVGTDAEQVIVASAQNNSLGLPTFSYMSGSLEHSSQEPPGVREQVCSILEGGTDAFHQRERRYSLS